MARQPLRSVKGLLSAHVAYPVAEWVERRSIRPERVALRRHHALAWPERRAVALKALAQTLEHAGAKVPYYRDLFGALGFDPHSVVRDPRHLESLPILTKDIIREQGERMLSQPLEAVRHHACRTGGSTGVSCTVFYDQPAADRAAAVALYARERVGKRQTHPETHFACRFPGDPVPPWPSREDFKCFGMNRTNIFFDRLDEGGLDEMWQALAQRRPVLVHAHPSTVFALACHVEKRTGSARLFEIFESSGELLETHMRDRIARVFGCRIVNRYGLAELGIVAYEFGGGEDGLEVLESEAWPDTRDAVGRSDGEQELVFTGIRNRLMPLIRYATGDLGTVRETDSGLRLEGLVGRIHDIVPINGVEHATHHIQDVLDHRVDGVREFQIDLRSMPPKLRIVPETEASPDEITARIDAIWPSAFDVVMVGPDDLVRVGARAKFRHVVTA